MFGGTYGAVAQNFLGVGKVKPTMDARRDFRKLIFLGEYRFSTIDIWMKVVPDQARASYLKSAYTNARSLPYVEGMSWYNSAQIARMPRNGQS